ncbi:hypothetical protein K438DRAFT_1933709 [Mycena galopus ATCC 62051]|nr:hypothetical protein K438DRAFT_1933709 [Mycena galopus ATCC 62051]
MGCRWRIPSANQVYQRQLGREKKERKTEREEGNKAERSDPTTALAKATTRQSISATRQSSPFSLLHNAPPRHVHPRTPPRPLHSSSVESRAFPRPRAPLTSVPAPAPAASNPHPVLYESEAVRVRADAAFLPQDLRPSSLIHEPPERRSRVYATHPSFLSDTDGSYTAARNYVSVRRRTTEREREGKPHKARRRVIALRTAFALDLSRASRGIHRMHPPTKERRRAYLASARSGCLVRSDKTGDGAWSS